MMMMMSDDLDLSQLGESVKDEVRRRIMQQEVEFRDQVREVHRLYWTQKNLMRELKRKEQSAKAALVVDSSKEGKGNIIDINEDPLTGLDFRFPSDVGNVAFDKKGEGRRSVIPQRSSLYCYEVIDSTEPGESGIRVGGIAIAPNSFGPPISRGGELQNFRPLISADVPSSTRVRNEPGLVPLEHFLHAGHDERWREQMVPISGSGFHETSAADFIDSSTDVTQKEPPPASRPFLIDLNIAQDDEPSHDFNNHILNFSSPSCSSVAEHELLRKDEAINKCYKVTGAVLKPDALNSALAISKEEEWWLPGCHSQNSEVRETIQCQEHEVGNKALGSDSNGSAECSRNVVEEFSSCPIAGIASSARLTTLTSTKLSKAVDENPNSSSGKQTSIVTSSNYIEVRQLNCEGSEEDTVSSHAIALQGEKEDAPIAKFLTVTKCNHMTGGISDASSHDKNIGGHSGTTQLEAQQHEDQAAEMDLEITAAADALVCISSQKLLSLGGADKNDEPQYSSDSFNEPQYSSDSFESMTLKLPKIKSEHLVLTKPVEDEARGGASGVKRLRRGRGRAVRDFQNDILPGIVSLSRHEICEDMHNIGYQLRKNGSRKTCEDSWFVPVRSRRSKRNCAGRRH